MADTSTESWTYDSQFSRVTSHTDAAGRVTLYDIDSATGDILSVTVGSGAEAATTSFTYTDGSGALPPGLLLSVEDPLGQVTTYEYYDNPSHVAFGRLATVTYASGTADEATVGFEYDAGGNVTATIDELGRRTEYEYNALDQLTRMMLSDPDGAGPQSAPEYIYEYCACGMMNNVTDPLGNETHYTFDVHHRATKVQAPTINGDRPEWTYSYDAVGNLTSTTDTLGRVTSYTYDALNRLSSMTEPDPDGPGGQSAPVWTYTYDAFSNLTSVTDPLGNETAYQYDLRNRLVNITEADPDGPGPQLAPVTTYSYDASGLVTSVTDALGRVTSYAYDSLGQLTTLTLPDPDGAGPQTAPEYVTTYDKAGNVTSQTDPLGNTTSYVYDARHRLTQITEADPDGAGPLAAPVTTYVYDVASQLTSVTDPLGRTTSYEYDALGRATKITLPDPDGAGPQLAPWTTFTYDAAGNLLSQANRLGHTTSYAYDNLYRQISETDANGDATHFAYDLAGNLISLTDPVDNTTTWVYDGLNRVIEETNQLDLSRHFAYDAVGNLTQKTDRNARVTEYQYDNLHRRTAELWKDGASTLRTINFTYDLAGQLLSTSDPDHEYDYSYDGLGRVTGQSQQIAGLAPVITFASVYDLAGNRTQLKATISIADDFINHYTYDNLHRLSRLTQAGQTGGTAVAEKRIEFAYDAANQWDTITRYADLAGSKLVVESAYTFDHAGRLTSLTHAQDTTTLVDYDWTFDHAGRLTQYVNSIDGTADYTYDDRDQLVGADYNYQTDEAYTYDENGNRTNIGYVTGDNNQLLSDGVFDYEYDAEGNRTRKTNIATGAVEVYEWDHRNRLVKVTEYADENDADLEQNSLEVVEHTYDAFNQWTSRTVDPDGDSGSTAVEQTFFLYEKGQISLQFDKTGTGDAAATDLSHRYLWGPAVDQILADENATGDILWPLADHLGTVRDLAEYDDANDTTSIVNHRTFDAFGELASETGTATILFGFTGAVFDAYSDLYNRLHRWYDFHTGRWTSVDPIGILADDSNFYRYVGNSPALYIDPLGLESWGSWWTATWANVKRYPGEVGATAKGYFWDGPVNTVVGVGTAIVHPVQTLQGVGTAIRHPIQTGQAIAENVGEQWNSGNEGKGAVCFEIVTTVLGGPKAAATAADKAADLGRLGRLGAKATDVAISPGAARAAKYGHLWQKASLEKAIARHAGENHTTWVTKSGKRIYENPTTGRQVVQDLDGGYFRIFQPTEIGGKNGKYLDMLGDTPSPARRVKGGEIKAVPLCGDELEQWTHFLIE